jgi:hypothetical protein
VGEYHRVDEADPISDPGGGEVGDSREHACPEEDRAGDREREAEALE